MRHSGFSDHIIDGSMTVLGQVLLNTFLWVCLLSAMQIDGTVFFLYVFIPSETDPVI